MFASLCCGNGARASASAASQLASTDPLLYRWSFPSFPPLLHLPLRSSKGEAVRRRFSIFEGKKSRKNCSIQPHLLLNEPSFPSRLSVSRVARGRPSVRVREGACVLVSILCSTCVPLSLSLCASSIEG